MSKSEKESENYRKLGNDCFAKKNFDDAFENYAKSVLFAPTCSESLAFAFGNRSALFYEIGSFKECQRDIRRAISCPNCPNILKEKLLRREEKCRMENLTDGLASASLDNQNVDEKIPDLDGGSNEKIRGVSGKIAMEFDSKLGRRLMAKESIDAGAVLIIERPYASILLEHTRTTYCHGCNAFLPLDFIPCNQCVDVRFCSEKCLEDDRSNHALECGQVDRLYGIGLAYLAFKLFTVSSIEDFAGTFDCDHHSNDGPRRQTDPNDGRFGLEKDEVYDGGFRSVWNLMAHHGDIKPQDLSIYDQTAKSLGRLLRSRKQWPRIVRDLFEFSSNICGECKSCTSDAQKSEMANDFVSSAFLRFIEILICNAHAISALIRQTPPSPAIDCHERTERTYEEKIASAIYPVASLMNHSCRPNIFSSFIGRTLIVRATRTIAAGEEILNCYGPQFGRMLTEERKDALKQQYYFDCACDACTEPEFAEREKCFTAINCSKCPESNMEFPTRVFYIEDTVQKMPKPMFKDSSGSAYVCTKCPARTLVVEVEAKIKKIVDEISRALKKSDPSKDERASKKLIGPLSSLGDVLYVHNKEMSEWRDKVAEWILGQKSNGGSIDQAIMLIQLNLFSVSLIYGETSAELANEIVKFLDVASTALVETPHLAAFFTRRGRHLLTELSEKAEKIFKIHYGPNCPQIDELKTIKEAIPK